MISDEQEKWIGHLSESDKIEIYPYDPLSAEKFDKIAEKIRAVLPQAKIELRGAAALKISGQKEIDVYIPASPTDFDDNINKISAIFGKPRSYYSLQRTRFVDYIGQTKAEIFVINKESNQWLDCLKFENYLIKNPDALKKYEKLKESGHNLSVREYYRRKTEFINSIIEKI
jgi:GrpB-like predicted nucleotidyltransferase (UPF0157 family)